MIMWRTLFGASVDMGQDAKTEFRVFLENLARRHIVAQMGGDEVIILKHLLQQRAYLLLALGSEIGPENAVTVGGELFEGVRHNKVSSNINCPSRENSSFQSII